MGVVGRQDLHMCEASLSCREGTIPARDTKQAPVSKTGWSMEATPLISALRRQRQAKLGEFDINLIYIVISRLAGETQRDTVSTTKPKPKSKP